MTEQPRRDRHRVTYRQATVTAVDPVAVTYDADVAGAGVIGPIKVKRVQHLPTVGDVFPLRFTGATPVHPEPNRVYPMVTDPLTGDTRALIDDEGNVNGQAGHFQSLTIGGQSFVPPSVEGPRGVLAKGERFVTSPAATTEVGFFEVAADLEPERQYRVETSSLDLQSSLDGTVVRAKIRYTDDGTTPTLSDPLIGTISKLSGTGDVTLPIRALFTPQQAGVHRFLLTVARSGGSAGDAKIFGRFDFPIQMWVEDVGQAREDASVDNDGSGSATTTKQTYTNRYFATWSGSYGVNYNSTVGTEMRQGTFSGVDWRSLVGFDYAQIMSDLAGATIESCDAYFYATQWYGSNPTAVIGTHAHGSRPDVFSANTGRWTSAGWPNPGARRVSLGTVVGNEFKTGTTRGFSLGPAPSSSSTYAGRFSGDAGSPTVYEPYVEIAFSR